MRATSETKISAISYAANCIEGTDVDGAIYQYASKNTIARSASLKYEVSPRTEVATDARQLVDTHITIECHISCDALPSVGIRGVQNACAPKSP